MMTFKKKLEIFVIDITFSNKIRIKADKSRNQYKIDPPLYDKITEKYKWDQDNIIDETNKDTHIFTNKLNIKNK